MSVNGYIKKRIEDSDFLIAHGRYESALLLLLTAIDASAIKVFPEGTDSLDSPKKEGKKQQKMRNGERYKRFLGVRILELLGFVMSNKAYYEKLPNITNSESPQSIIYKALRCNDVHEGRIPYEYHYIYSESSTSDNYSVSFSGNDVVFNRGFLTLLRNVVVEAPCNDEEFGRASLHIDYGGFDSDKEYGLVNKDKFQLSPGRIQYLVQLYVYLKKRYAHLSQDELTRLYSEYIKNTEDAAFSHSGYYEGSNGPTEGVRNRFSGLTPTGQKALKFIFHDILFSRKK